MGIGKWALVVLIVVEVTAYSCDLEMNSWRKKPRLKLNDR
jgi:hypothetical protein